MATTTNYGWTTPDDTALVKDGASAIRTLGSSVDTTTKALNPGTTAGDIDYYSSSTSKTRVGIGSTGQVLTVAGGIPAWATPSSGATTWTRRLTGTGTTFRQIAYNGTNLYVAAGSSGQLYTSPDGVTWTSRTSGFGTDIINDVAYGNGLWVIVGANGLLSTSTDAITWTSRTANMSTGAIAAVTYANSLWVAVGQGGGTINTGGITYSSDGITWTRKSQSLTVGPTYTSIAWNGTNWIVGSNYSTNNYLYASTPSGTWTVGATSASGLDIAFVYSDGTRTYIVEKFGSGQQTYYSTSATFASWTINQGVPKTLNPTIGNYKAYSGYIYSAEGYITSFQTSVTTAYPLVRTPVISPTAYPIMEITLQIPYITAPTTVLWVGAAGTIISTFGSIYTSF